MVTRTEAVIRASLAKVRATNIVIRSGKRTIAIRGALDALEGYEDSLFTDSI